MEIKITYSKSVAKNIDKEKLIYNVVKKSSAFLKLPHTVTIRIETLDPGLYAQTDITYKKIVLNSLLELNDIIFPLVHELIHLEQIETGKLNRSKQGKYVWEGQVYDVPENITHENYKQLPWEHEITKKNYDIVKKVLEN